MRLSRLLKAPGALYRSLRTLLRDLRGARYLVPMSEERRGGVIYRGLQRKRIPEMARLYSALSGANPLAWYRRLAYWLVGNRMAVVAIVPIDSGERLVGFDIFYFNQKDIKEETIHEGFIGVASEWRNRGIAQNLRRHAIDNFRNGRLKGISSRVDVDNIPSLKSAIKTGFMINDTYRDETLARDRHYLVCRFSGAEIQTD